MNRILNFFPHRAHHRTNILFLEQGDNGVACTNIIEDTRTRTSAFSESLQFVSFEAATSQHLARKNFDRVLVVLDASRAATVKSIVRIPRESPEEAITEGELDAVLFRALWSFLNRFRPFAATKLGVSELDLVVANIAVCGVRIEDHKVFNPLDFKGTELIIEFRGTFIPRVLVSSIERMSSYAKEPVMAIERGAILAEALQEDVIFIDIGETQADVYQSYEGEASHIGRCEWGVRNITEKLGRHFGVPNNIVSEVLKSYNKNQISEKVRNVIGGIARKEVAALRESLEAVMTRANTQKRLPIRFAISARGAFPSELIEDARLTRVKLKDKEGEEVRAPHVKKVVRAALTGAQDEAMVLIHYPYIHPQYAFLNQLLRRRVKWLVPHE